MTLGIITNRLGKAVFLEHAFMTSTTTTLASQFKVGTGQTVLDEGSTDLSQPVYITGTQEYGEFTTGFPTISTSGATPEITINCRLSGNQSTGNTLDTIALFNTDTTPKLMIQMNHADESKGVTDEFIYIIKQRVL